MYQEDFFEEKLNITQPIREKLLTIANWSKVLTIMVLASKGMELISAIRTGSIIGPVVGFGIAFAIYLCLLRFSLKLKIALDHNDQEHLYSSFKNLETYAIVIGIILILSLIGVLIAFISIGANF